MSAETVARWREALDRASGSWVGSTDRLRAVLLLPGLLDVEVVTAARTGATGGCADIAACRCCCCCCCITRAGGVTKADASAADDATRAIDIFRFEHILGSQVKWWYGGIGKRLQVEEQLMTDADGDIATCKTGANEIRGGGSKIEKYRILSPLYHLKVIETRNSSVKVPSSLIV